MNIAADEPHGLQPRVSRRDRGQDRDRDRDRDRDWDHGDADWRYVSRCPELPFERVSCVPLWHQLAQALRAAMVTGALLPGQRLDRQADLCAAYNLSAPTVRHVLADLRRTGHIVRGRERSSYLVAPRDQWDSTSETTDPSPSALDANTFVTARRVA